jgi:hypothetical protein
MNQGNPPPNWYPDPRGEAELRYWDGNQWTEHTHSGPGGGDETVAAPVPAAPPPSTAPPPQAAPPPAAAAVGPQGAYGPGPSGQMPSGSSGGGSNKLPLIIGGAVAAAIVVGLVLFLVVGGGEEKTEEDRVNDAATEILTTEDTSACRELATQNFVEKSTGQEGDAAFEECEQEGGRIGEEAEITNTEVDGTRATVEAEVTGGQIDGENVEVSLVKQDDEWKLDDLIRTDLTQGEKAESAVLNTVLNFGSSEGDKACQYLSFSKLKELGGVSGCESQFANATAANYTPDNVDINDTKATVVVTETRQDKTIQFEVVHEAGNWKIADFQGQ